MADRDGPAFLPAAPQAWLEPLDRYELWTVASDWSDETRRVRFSQLRRFARVHPDPWAVDGETLVAFLANRDWSAETRASLKAALTGFYRWAQTTGRTDRDPTIGLPKSKVRAGVPRPTPTVVLVEALDRASSSTGTRRRVERGRLMLVLLAAGLSCTEVGRIRPSDLTGRALAVRGVSARLVTLTNGAAEDLVAALAGGYFPSETGAPLTTGAVDGAVRPLLAPGPRGEPLQAQAVRSLERYEASPPAVRARRSRLMLLLAAYVGLRRSEIAKVHTDDIVEGTVRVTGKGGKTRIVPLVPEVLELVATLPAGWLFPGKIDGHMSPDAVGVAMTRLLGPGWSAHTLRHRFATLAYGAERDVFAVQMLLGHSRPETTARYAAFPAEAAGRAVLAAAGVDGRVMPAASPAQTALERGLQTPSLPIFDFSMMAPDPTPDLVVPTPAAQPNSGFIVLLEEWLSWHQAQGNREQTIVERRRVVTALGESASCDPAAATDEDLQTYMITLQSRAPATRATYYAHLKSWFKWLVARGHRETNPCDRLPAPRFPRRHPRPVSNDQIERLLAINMHRRTRTMVLLAAFQGLRVHEIAKLRGEDISLVDRTLRVVGKNEVDALMPLHPLVVAEAQTNPREGYWFTTHVGNRLGVEGHILSHSVSDILSLAMSRAEINGGAHRLRHWYATKLVAQGANLRVVQELLRHASLQTTQIYTQITLDQQREALELLALPSSITAE